MEPNEELDDRTRDLIAVAYEVITSKVARDGLMADEALLAMEGISYEMRTIAGMFGLGGRMAQIFASLVVDQLNKFDWWELMAYCNLMHIEVPPEVEERKNVDSLAILVYNNHIVRLQRMRLKRYAAAIFFGTPETREELRPEIFHIEDGSVDGILLNEEEIREKGVDYWFPQVGGLTLDSVSNRFSYFEACYILMLIGTLDPREAQKSGVESKFKWKLTTDLDEEDIYRALIVTYTLCQYDSRSYLTLDGPKMSYLSEANEAFYPLNDTTILETEDLAVIAKQEGIELYITEKVKPNVVVMFEWTVSQLSSTFVSHFGDHRERMQASRFENTVSGQNVIDFEEEELVYFGERDGMSEMTVYSIKELYDTFREPKDVKDTTSTGHAYDPILVLQHPIDFLQWRQFPRRTIVRLLEQVLPTKRHSIWTSRLENECRRILSGTEGQKLQQKVQASLIKSLKEGDKNVISTIIVRMFNSGLTLMQLDEEIDVYDDESIDQFVMNDPLRIPPEPFMTGRVQQEFQNCIMDIEEGFGLAGEYGILFKQLLIVESYYDIHVTHFEDYFYEIGNFMVLLSKLATLNMTSMLILAGRWLYITASYYSEQILGYPISALMVTLDQESHEYDKFDLPKDSDEDSI